MFIGSRQRVADKILNVSVGGNVLYTNITKEVISNIEILMILPCTMILHIYVIKACNVRIYKLQVRI